MLKKIIDDLKEDWKCIKNLASGNTEEYRLKDKFKAIGSISFLKSTLKAYWPFFVLIIAAFLIGWGLAAAYYEVVCNNYVNSIINNPQNLHLNLTNLIK